MNNYITKITAGYPYNDFNFYIGDETGKAWYDDVVIYKTTDPYPVHVSLKKNENYKSYISFELILCTLFFYNKINFKDHLYANKNTNNYLIDLYQKLNNIDNTYNKLDTIIDVGAHHGFYSLNYSSISKKVIAIEPYIKNFAILQKNLEINNINNIFAYNYYITNQRNNLSFTNLDKFKFCNENFESCDCITKTLDDLLPYCSNNMLIKLDTEGEEVKILEQSQQVIKQYKPNFLIELHSTCLEDLNDIKKYIPVKNYEIVKINKYTFYPELSTENDNYNNCGYLFCRALI
jgi:FkbM family methyltransferase